MGFGSYVRIDSIRADNERLIGKNKNEMGDRFLTYSAANNNC
jgi:hypothetical protein